METINGDDQVGYENAGAPLEPAVPSGVRVMKVQKIRVSSAILESMMVTGATIPQRVVTAGLPEGSRFIGCDAADFGRELVLHFALPDGSEPTSDEWIVLRQPAGEKVYKIQRTSDGKFSQGGAYTNLSWKWTKLGKIWSTLKNLRAHLAQHRMVPGEWEVVEYALVEIDRKPAASLVPTVH